jgi:hypothetical protein
MVVCVKPSAHFEKLQQIAHLDGPNAARAYELAHMLISGSLYFLRTIILHVSGAFFGFLILQVSAAKCMQKLFYSKKMADFAHSKPDEAPYSQPRYMPLVSMGASLGQWPESYISFYIDE